MEGTARVQRPSYSAADLVSEGAPASTALAVVLTVLAGGGQEPLVGATNNDPNFRIRRRGSPGPFVVAMRAEFGD